MMNGEVDTTRGLAQIYLYHEQSSNTIDGAPLDSGEWRGYGCYQVQTDGVIANMRSMQKENYQLIQVRRSFEDFCVCEFLKILERIG